MILKYNKSSFFVIVACICLLQIFCVVKAYDEETDDDDYHQLVVFAISGLTGSSSGYRFMPYTMDMGKYGAWTPKARTVSSTKSIPEWVGIFYGATPTEYGCVDNENCSLPPEKSNHRSIVELLEHEYGYAVSIFSDQDDGRENEMITTFKNKYPVQIDSLKDSHAIVTRACSEEYLPQTNKRLLIFHFYGLEMIGKSMGYDSHNYRGYASCIDQRIKEISQSLWDWDSEYSTFLVVSDHGGVGYGHQHLSVETVQVPLFMWGYGIKKGVSLFSKSVDTTQISPTIVSCLGYDIPDEWRHPALKYVKMYTPDDDYVSYTLEEYKNTNHTNPYDSHDYCIVPITTPHETFNNVRASLIAVFIVAMAVVVLCYCYVSPDAAIDNIPQRV